MVCSLEYFKLYTKQKLSISDIPELPDKVFNISAGLTKFTIHNAQFSQEINLRQPTIVCSFILANSEHKRTKIGYFIHLFPKTQLSIIFSVNIFSSLKLDIVVIIGTIINSIKDVILVISQINVMHPFWIYLKKWQCGLVHYLKILCDDIFHYFWQKLVMAHGLDFINATQHSQIEFWIQRVVWHSLFICPTMYFISISSIVLYTISSGTKNP